MKKYVVRVEGMLVISSDDDEDIRRNFLVGDINKFPWGVVKDICSPVEITDEELEDIIEECRKNETDK